MPAPIAIGHNEKYWLKYYLEETYATRINDAYSCKVLSNEILKRTEKNISYSTIRRLFDLVPNSNSLSRFILNELAYAIGFKNWDEFEKYILKFDTNTINQNIQNYSRKLPNSSTIILQTIKDLPIETWEGAYQFQLVISLAIQNRDFKLLSEIIRLPIDINNPSIYEHLVIGFQSFYFNSISGDNELIDFVQSNISQSILLQKCLLQAYVDENYLKGFFGRWIEAINENTLADLLLFKNLVLCQKSFIENDINQAKSYLKKALKESKNQLEIHPILKARIGVWSLILVADEKPLKSYFSSLIKPFDKADFAVIASRLLWMFHKEKSPISFLDEINIKNFPTVKDFFQKGRYNVLLITLSINYLLKNNHPKAREYFSLFNANDLAYDIVNIDFYLPWIEELKGI